MADKLVRIYELLDRHSLDALLLRQVSNFAWATNGSASYINRGATNGAGSLLVTREAHYLLTSNIEFPRFEQEEGLLAQGWQPEINRWDQPGTALARLTAGLKLGADGPYPGAVDLSGELTILRSYLDVDEQARFKQLSATCGIAMAEAARAVRPGMNEYQIAGLLAQAVESRGVRSQVLLIATDQRIFNFRHPLPTAKQLDKYAMLVLCGRQQGLVCSLTRLVHFGPLPAELQRKADAVAQIDATMIAATRPGSTVADIFRMTQETYARVGYADEWQLHHQGGPAAYDPREFVATATVNVPVGVGQAYAWNPSITGTKSEDTILVGEQANQVMSVSPGWPTIPVEIAGETIERPAILVLE